MAIRVSKRILRYALLAGLLVFFGWGFSNHEAVTSVSPKAILDNFQAPLAGFKGLQTSGDSSSAEKMEEETRKKAESAQEAGEKYEEVAPNQEALELLKAAGGENVTMDQNGLAGYGSGDVKACFVSLVRNSDLWSIVESIRHVEDRFNNKFKYTWVFLNDEEFSDEFKTTVSRTVSGDAKFGVIPEEHWSYPSWIDQGKAAQTRIDMKGIIYGDSESYRHMCRFESGFFWRHPLLDEFDWYWRVEPDIKIHCDIDYDVFKWMRDNNKVYGFTISIHEYEATIKTLWKTTKDFIKLHPEYVHDNNMMDFVSDDKGKTYNLCHFWSNFEVANLNFWRSQPYRDYFDYLDKSGGFFYERWGDAPVHSIAAALFLPRDQIHYFPDIGYYHPPYNNCPLDKDLWTKNKCACDQNNDFTFQGYSCGNKYFEVNKMVKPAGWDALH
ncbi:LAMI_0H07448g1_1 [Lachancea mirantina]|uniref:LAMI_0H07448g1_1 n=1 Tax=Lachancea mirantina TaxID=1230905 RepID=A0A1G4KG74_9SACH|nr:LAMI_0H07448g1_1 [Lachancea mirantina]